ncbi:arsenate reductase (glutaredoxin) [Herbaspirillum autotrophicum]|uniref:arsenate reductase (glutaredoxin) n=1 Tax=Herbaspirillum autotrophicum TaxID=180195 RepID=UPI00067C1BD1|nr:arsenate reductase (glutaredoxin) [Herbaspirillum autotrophicum]
MSDVTIYHNPACGTSRNVLAALRERGIEPVIIEYLKNPPDQATLSAIAKATGKPLSALLRRKGPVYEELQLDRADLSDPQLLTAMLAHPVLIERPIVVTPLGTRLCRPAEVLQEILPPA